MRKFVQAFIVVVGFGAAIAAVQAQQRKPTISNCIETASPNNPTVCS